MSGVAARWRPGDDERYDDAMTSPAAEPAHTDLWVSREGSRRYSGHSSRGARVEVGNVDVEGVFTPGELLKIALASCTAMASDSVIARRLGDDYQSTVRVAGAADRSEEVYPLITEDYELDLSSLSAEEAQKLLTLVRRAVDASCTVGRTVSRGARVDLEIETGTFQTGTRA